MKRWRAGLAPVAAGVIAFLVYRATLAPGLTWAHAGTDGGDLVTAAAVWGVPHPPGYPIYTFLGHLFAFLPFGSIAFNLNLFSALYASLASAVTAAAVLRGMSAMTLQARFAALVAGLTLAFGPMLWGQATIAEVHAFNALLVSVIVYITRPWNVPRVLDRTEIIALGLTWGLSLTHSPTNLALAPIVLPALWRDRHTRRAGFGALGAGLCAYLLIPIRAAASPPINWGDARTLPDFLWLISGGLYRGYALSAPVDLVIQRLLGLPREWFEQLGWIGAVWLGFGFARARSFKAMAPAFLSAALFAAFAVTYDTADSDLYLIPVWILSAGYLGAGLAGLLARRLDRLRQVALVALAACGVIAMMIGGWSGHDLSRDYQAEAWAGGTLAALPPGAILVTHADAHTFTLWYYRVAEARRRDVSIVDSRLLGYAWYVPMLRAQGSAPNLPADRTESNVSASIAAVNPTRPVCDLEVPPQDDALPVLRCD